MAGRVRAGRLRRGQRRRSSARSMGFAEFGFPKAHAAAFGLSPTSPPGCALLPGRVLCALFNNQPMGFYPPHVLVNDAKRHGVDVLPPDINLSGANCTMEEPSARIALAPP